MKILIVDDSMFLRKILKDILINNGHEVIGEAEDGDTAVTKYHKLKPDLVTMDITMPGISGIDAMKKIILKDPKAKVIMCSAIGKSDFITESILSGALDFITKPFSKEKIIYTLKKYNSIICE